MDNTKEFLEESCELIEIIQELDLNIAIAKQKLAQLKDDYIKSREEAEAANE